MHKLKVKILSQGNLTTKEVEVLRYLCKGYTRKEIADEPPKRSISTINRQVESIAHKLEANSQAQIVATAVALELVEIKIIHGHSLFTRCLLGLLAVISTNIGNVNMRRGPTTPRPIRTARTSRRASRSTEQHPEDLDFDFLMTAMNNSDDQLKHFYLEKKA